MPESFPNSLIGPIQLSVKLGFSMQMWIRKENEWQEIKSGLALFGIQTHFVPSSRERH